MFWPGARILVGHESDMPVENVSEGTWVYSVDQGKGCFSRITRKTEERHGGYVVVVFDDGRALTVGPKTKVLVKGRINGWKRASSLKPTMKLLCVVEAKPAWAPVAVVSQRSNAPPSPVILLEARPHRAVVVNGVACRA